MQADFTNNKASIQPFILDKEMIKTAPAEALILYKNAALNKCKTSQCIRELVSKRRERWHEGKTFCPRTDNELHQALNEPTTPVNKYFSDQYVVYEKDMQCIMAPSPFFSWPALQPTSGAQQAPNHPNYRPDEHCLQGTQPWAQQKAGGVASSSAGPLIGSTVRDTGRAMCRGIAESAEEHGEDVREQRRVPGLDEIYVEDSTSCMAMNASEAHACESRHSPTHR